MGVIAEKSIAKLRQRKRKIENDIEKEKKIQAESSRRINESIAALRLIEEDIKNMAKDEDKLGLRISDHAIVRYLERIEKVDIEKIKLKICPIPTRILFSKLGAGTYPVDGFKIKIKDNTVVTVLD